MCWKIIFPIQHSGPTAQAGRALAIRALATFTSKPVGCSPTFAGGVWKRDPNISLFLSFPGSFTNLHLDLKQFECYMQLLLDKSRAVRMQLYPPQCYDITPVRTVTPLEGRQSRLRFDHRMVDNLGNNTVGCVKVAQNACLTGGGLAADGLANGREAAAASITRALLSKRSLSRMDFHPEHHFEASHLQMPSLMRTLTGPQGRWISRARLRALRLRFL